MKKLLGAVVFVVGCSNGGPAPGASSSTSSAPAAPTASATATATASASAAAPAVPHFRATLLRLGFTVETKPVVTTQLMSDYATNAVGAEAKYKGKPIYMGGEISKIERAVDGRALLLFEPKNDQQFVDLKGRNIHAFLDENEETKRAVAALTPPAGALVVCEKVGNDNSFTIEMTGCTVFAAPPKAAASAAPSASAAP